VGREEMGADEEEVNEVEPKWNRSGTEVVQITAHACLLNENTSSKKKKFTH